jgi:Tol biopolymer transport system component
MILGTVNYMSPEQARGMPADYRSDQFSFGVMLYEMASGKKAFERAESVQTMSAILTEDPPPIDRDIPAPLRWTIDRCLAKDPADRYESSRDLFRELRQIRDYAGSKSSPQVAVVAPAPKRRVAWIVPAIAAAACVGAFFVGRNFAGERFPDQSTYEFTPFAFDPGGQGYPVWSPDGKAVAYAGRPDGPGSSYQVMVRYLDQPMPRRLTQAAGDAIPVGWTPDHMRVFFRAPGGLWSASVVGGEPDKIMELGPLSTVDISPDAKSLVTVRLGDDGVYAVFVSSPIGSPYVKYPGDPLRTRALFNQTRARFSPDGKSILAIFRPDRGADEFWLLPYPADKSHAPKRVLPNVRSFNSIDFAWTPDSRRAILSLSTSPAAASQLWMADISSGRVTQLTSGTTPRTDFSISGDRVVFRETVRQFDIVSLDLTRGTVERLIASERSESMPAWAAGAHAFVYVTDRSGPLEIWLRDHAGDRPIVTGRDFPLGTTQWFMAPALSPDASRVAYSRVEDGGPVHLWISSVAGGAPVRATRDETSTEFPGSWSPDGSWFVYIAVRNGSADLMKVKASGQAAPVLVKAGVAAEPPSWSPDGNWIVSGDRLVSADGQTVRELPPTGSLNLAFSRDGKLLYGIRREGSGNVFFSIDAASGARKDIAKLSREFEPASDLRPAIRLSLAPDGGSITYAVGAPRSNLWMLTGALKP